MRKFMEAYKFQLKESVLQRGFVIMAIMMVLFVLIVSFANRNPESQPEVALPIYWVNQTEDFTIDPNALTEAFEGKYRLQALAGSTEETIEAVKAGKFQAIYVVGGEEGHLQLDQYYQKEAPPAVSLWLQQELSRQAAGKLAETEQVSEQVLDRLLQQVEMNRVELTEEKPSVGLVYPMIYIMFLLIMGFGQSIAVGVVGEKSSKVTEVLLPKIHPISMLYARIFAAMSTGLLQVVILAFSIGVSVLVGWMEPERLQIIGAQLALHDLELSAFLWFFFFFVTGFVFYGLLYATMGALVSKIEELNPLLTPLVLLLMGAFGIALYSVFEPTSMVAVVSSYIPPFTPVVLFARILVGVVSPAAVLGALTIFFATFALVTYVCQKWYKEGVSGGKSHRRKTRRNR